LNVQCQPAGVPDVVQQGLWERGATAASRDLAYAGRRLAIRMSASDVL
jgi:hypothetical protein